MPYVVRSSPRAVRLEDDVWHEPALTIQVITEDAAARDTGLLDSNGVKIWFVPKREKVGY
jgi:hypothetical protein